MSDDGEPGARVGSHMVRHQETEANVWPPLSTAQGKPWVGAGANLQSAVRKAGGGSHGRTLGRLWASEFGRRANNRLCADLGAALTLVRQVLWAGTRAATL